MITTIDRYMLKRCTLAMAMICTLVTAMVIGMDLLLQIGDLTDGGLPEGHSRGLLILQLALLKIPPVISPILPMAAIAGALLTITPMLRRGEFIAMVAGGVSLRRCCAALLVVSLGAGALDLVISDALGPRFESQRTSIEDLLTGSVQRGKSWHVTETGTDWFADKVSLRNDSKPVLRDVTAATPHGQIISASRLVFEENQWVLQNGVRVASPQSSQAPEIYEQLPTTGQLALPFSPQEISEILANRDAQTSLQLITRGERLDLTMAWQRWLRIVVPALCMLCAIPVFTQFENRNHLIVAGSRALLIAAVPAGIIAVGGSISETSDWPVALTMIGCALIAAIPGAALFGLWRQ